MAPKVVRVILLLCCVTLSSQLCNDFDKIDLNDRDVNQQLTRLFSTCNKLSTLTRNYDAIDVKHNGLRSFLTFLDKFFTKLSRLVRKSRDASVSARVRDSVDVVTQMVDIVESITSGQSSRSKFAVTHKLLEFDEDKLRTFMELGN